MRTTLLCATPTMTITVGRLNVPMWTMLLDPFALHAPFHHSRQVVFGLLEMDVLCATMTVTLIVGVDLGFSWGVSF